MFSIFLLIGFICLTHAGEASDFEDILSVFSNNNKNAATKANHKTTKNAKIINSHEPFEMTFPLFYDIFPMGGFEGRMKDSMKLYQEDKDPSPESEPRLFSKIFRQKKKPKDKVIMSFTEFFIPFSNHKPNIDSPAMPKKLDFFEDFFKDFPFKELEEPIFKHRFQRKMKKNTSKLLEGHNVVESTSINTYDASKKKDTMQKLDMLFHKPKEADIFLFQHGLENLDPGLEKQNEIRVEACCGNPECKNDEHCQKGMCTDRPPYEEDYRSKAEKGVYNIMDPVNLDRLLRIALLYTLPIFIGIGGIIVGIEILRKHKNMVKTNQLIKDYDPIQRC